MRELGSLVWAPYATARLGQSFALERDLAKAAAVLERELSADTPMETATERKLWCARADVLLARGAARESLEVAERLAASLHAGRVAPRLWIARRAALTALRSFDSAEPLLREAIQARARRIRPFTAYARAAG